ncbi:MAG: hypothetical protein PWQ57_1320 [Desulfovibrionales bacterium]|jgi:hypothetical protein|nr:hypothetical protein [Desulfovibrionales bacterium]
MTLDELFRAARAYTAAVLSYNLDGESPAPVRPAPAEERRAKAERTARLADKRNARSIILLGAGAGGFAEDLARCSALPVVVSETSATRARSLLREGRLQRQNLALLADASPWAHLLIWTMAGLTPENSMTALNPELAPEDRAEAQSLQRTFAGAKILEIDAKPSAAADIALTAMLHPEEPNLADFFAHAPKSTKNAAVLWDAETPPENVSTPTNLLQAAHPLGEDFSVQRNRMLQLAGDGWVFYLDADERTPVELDRMLPALASLPGVHGVHVPRLTLFPDDKRFKVGYGLWPDLQLRLFRKGPNVRFERPIHERITGLPGPRAIVLDAFILHLSRLLKRPGEIEAKLARFDRAGAARHRLNADYPTLPTEWLAGLIRPEAPRVLVV